MPLNRDQSSEKATTKSAPSFLDGRRLKRSIPNNAAQDSKPATPQDNSRRSSRKGSFGNNISENAGKQYAIMDESLKASSAVNMFKLPVQDTMSKPHTYPTRAAEPARQGQPVARYEKDQGKRRQHDTEVAEKVYKDPFDDTTSLGPSYFDSTLEDGHTAFLNPTHAARNDEALNGQDRMYGDEEENNRDKPVIWNSQMQQEVLREREYLERRHGVKADSKTIRHEAASIIDDHFEPETPSRTQSAPPLREKLHAPVPIKGVGFASEDEVHTFSPDFRSSDMVREESEDLPMSHLGDMQPHMEQPPLVARPQYGHAIPIIQSRQRHSDVTSNPDRFRNIREHHQTTLQENKKVSAPDSDIQDQSEDEQALVQHIEQRERNDDALGQDHRLLATGKRRHDDSSPDLDYSRSELGQKKLSDLQAEPFTRDPRIRPKPMPTDSAGQEIALEQILDGLTKLSGEAQRETFSAMNDEQWAFTGQWFVDKFQADLEELVKIRLQRRKVTLSYEDRIRRRQRQVEASAAEVEKELHELQAGGQQLVDGRKTLGASRSGTPLKKSK